MDLFKFDRTGIGNGQLIRGATSKSWTERYRDPGDFIIEAPLSSGLREFLPEGTFISHTKSLEIMIVENHEINEEQREDPTIKITGRSFETYLENRVIGVDLVRAQDQVDVYELTSGFSWIHARKIVNDHILEGTAHANDDLTDVECVLQSGLSVSGATADDREYGLEYVYPTLIDLLTIDDLGIRTFRPNTFGVNGDSTNTYLQIYKGVNRSNKVIFSWKAGDLEAAEYLFSGKKYKNAAIVKGRYIWVLVTTGPTNYNRRFMVVDADDLDGHFDTVPTGADLTRIKNRMTTRGNNRLKKQNRVTLSRADVSANSKYRYRRDYNVGDIVMVDGNFGQPAKLRVIEYAEIEDENGENGHPTLTIPGED
jgi:hypothetical protein